MFRARPASMLVAVVSLVAGLGVVGAAPAGADGTTNVPATCSNALIGSFDTSVDVNATDSADPVAPNASVTNTLTVPVPSVGDLPFSITLTEVQLTAPIPAGVTVTGVTFTPSSFPTQTWAVTGSNLVLTLKGSFVLSSGGPSPQVPNIAVVTNVGATPRTVSWKVPSKITAKADTFLGSQTITCTPTDPNQVLITTTVKGPNQAPVAADQAVTTTVGTAKAVTLSATDPDGDPLTYSVTTPPAHGTVSGSGANVTYTPAAGYVGPDSFVFTASDGSLSDTGTVSITVAPTVPGAPTGVTAKPHSGAVVLTWTPPSGTGGTPVTGYRIVPTKGGVAQAAVDVGNVTTATLPAANGAAWGYTVAAVNAQGVGPASAATPAVTPRTWLPFASAAQAVDRLYSWMLGRAPTQAERNLWLGRFTNGTHTPADLVVALRGDTISTGIVDPVVRLYEAYFLRTPDKEGITYWVAQRKGGSSLTKVSDFFARSNEFKVLYGTLNNRQFVERIYENILGRPGEASGVDYWTSELNSGKRSRGSVMIGFSESAEYKNRQRTKVDASVLLIFLENRTPTGAERNAMAEQVGATSLRETATLVLRNPVVVARATA